MRKTLQFAAGAAAIFILAATFGYTGVALREDGVQFPDGSIQETAAAAPGEPIQFLGSCYLDNSEYTGAATMFTVPGGMRFEIESVAPVAYNLAPTETIVASIGLTFGGQPTSFILHEFTGTTVYPGAPVTVRAVRPFNTRMYADPESDVDCQADSTSNAGVDRAVVFTIVGRLVPVG